MVGCDVIVCKARPTYRTVYHNRVANGDRTSVFMAAVGVIIIWAATGPLFHYSDTWQLIINTGTTIVTFQIVFLLQNTPNRDTDALQLKLDELIRTNKDARNTMWGLEDLSERDLKKLKAIFESLTAASSSRPDNGSAT